MYKYRIPLMIIIIILLYMYVIRKNKKDMSKQGILIVLAIFIISIIQFIDVKNITMIFLNPYILFFSTIALFFVLVKVFKIIRNLLYKIEAYNDIQTLHRDIDVQYNPSIASYLINGTIGVKDIAADIMNLYAKKIINIEKHSTNNKVQYKFILDGNKLKENKISESDKYIIDTVIERKYKFEFDVWNNFVESNLLNMGVYKKERKQFNLKSLFIKVIIVFLISIIPMQIYFKEIIFAFLFSLIIAFMSIIPIVLFSDFKNSKEFQKLNLNNIGKEEIKKWIKFKKFIKEYTLIKDKNIEDIVIYEKYIPYAVALEINLNYEQTMYSVFNEREFKEILNDISDKGVFENYL